MLLQIGAVTRLSNPLSVGSYVSLTDKNLQNYCLLASTSDKQ